MEIGSALRVLHRRWIVVLVGAAITLGLAGYTYTSAAPSYRASANLLLLLPSDVSVGEGRTSPFLYLPSELNVLARVVAAAAPSRRVQAELQAQGLTTPYEVGIDPRNPIITVGVEGPDPDNVLATRTGLVAAIQDELAAVQEEADAPLRQTAGIRVFGAEDTPTELGGSATRGVLAILAAGGLLTLLAAFAIDWLLTGRRRSGPRRKPRSRPIARDRARLRQRT